MTELVCAVGHQLFRDDNLDGQDWESPCMNEVTQIMMVAEMGEYGFCAAHWPSVFESVQPTYLGETLVEQRERGIFPSLN